MKSNKLFRLRPLFLLCTILFLTVGCSKKDEPGGTIPVVSTNTVIDVSATRANSGGEVTSDGGSAITARGVCWGTSPEPTIADNKTSDGSATGSFFSNLFGLTPNTAYHVRAYATNSAGTAYGASQSFSTTNFSVIIGTQEWMVENLNVTNFRNGDPIPLQADPTIWSTLTTPAYTNYDNVFANGNTLGHLYNWYAINDSKNICPAGWHIPTLDEWTTMIASLGDSPAAAAQLKTAGTTYWLSPNTGATNLSGFSALGSGHRHVDGTFGHINVAFDIWLATDVSTTDAYFGVITNEFDPATAGIGIQPKQFGFSVRCIKD